MSSDEKKPFPANPRIVTFRYRGPDRRGGEAPDRPESRASGEVTFDAKGNPVWNVRITEPRRRKDDDTIDLLKTLDIDSIALEGDEVDPDDTGYNPYRRDGESS